MITTLTRGRTILQPSNYNSKKPGQFFLLASMMSLQDSHTYSAKSKSGDFRVNKITKTFSESTGWYSLLQEMINEDVTKVSQVYRERLETGLFYHHIKSKKPKMIEDINEYYSEKMKQ